MRATESPATGQGEALGVKPITGDYIMPAIPPYFPELRLPATLIRTLENGRVLLRDDEMKAKGCSYLIETTADAFQPHGGAR